jgi:hypothetical protein
MTLPPIPDLSSEWVSTLVASRTDPTAGDDPEFAFTLNEAKPESGDWLTGEWETAREMPDGRWQTRAKIFIGPGSTAALTAEEWSAWWRIPNGPMRLFDTITIF